MSVTLQKGDQTEFKVTGEVVPAKRRVNVEDDVNVTVNLLYEEGRLKDLDVEERVIVTGPNGQVVHDNSGTRSLPLKSKTSRSFSFNGRDPGTYKIRSSVSDATGVLWSGEASVVVSDKDNEILVTGDAVAKKGRVKMDERVDVGVNLLYEQGPESPMTFKETVELFDPKGVVVQNNFGQRTLTRNQYSERNFAITCQQPGMFRLKSTLSTMDGKRVWTGETTFEVTSVGKPVMQKPGQGYYKLKNKVVGHGGETVNGGYGTSSGSIGESSYSFTYEGVNGYDSHASLSLQWSTPPTVIKPNDTVDLTVTGSGSVTGKDHGAVGVSGQWGVEGGGAQVIESKVCFVGIASNGQLYPSGTGKYKVKVGEGASFKIYNGHAGCTWGSSDNWTPCVYEYEWVANAAPPDDTTSGKKATIEVGNTEERPAPDDETAGGVYGDYAMPMKAGVVNESFAIEIRLTASKKEGVYIVTGFLRPNREDSSRTLNLTGSYYTSTHRLAVSGNPGGPVAEDWTTVIDGTLGPDGFIEGFVTMTRDRDGYVQKGKFRMKKG